MIDFRVASIVPTDITAVPSTCEERTSTTAILEGDRPCKVSYLAKVWFLFKSLRRRQTYAEKGKYDIYRGAGK
uniref:Uncharacterized protein n=1 Tax=Oryza nivara TaxID=4536 RepID=A0A0E0HA83_ORYNI